MSKKIKLSSMVSVRPLIRLLGSSVIILFLVVASAPGVTAPPLGCSNLIVCKPVGSVNVCPVSYIRPTTPRVVLLSGSNPSDAQIIIRVDVFDDCFGGAVGVGVVEIEFTSIYAQYGRRVAPGSIITIPKRYGNLAGTARYLGSPMFGESQKAFRFNIRYYTVFDFLLENLWLIVLVILALSAYKFFTSRRFDFYELWQEFKGKR